MSRSLRSRLPRGRSSGVCGLVSDMQTQVRSPLADEVISRLATAQHGVMARAQLLDAGLKAGAVGRWLRAGRLVQIHRGVYAAGHAELTLDGGRMAAVLACGPDSGLSHRAA